MAVSTKQLPKVGDIVNGRMCKVVVVNEKGTAVCWGNPNPDPVEHQKGIDDFNDYILDCVARRMVREEKEKQEKQQAE